MSLFKINRPKTGPTEDKAIVKKARAPKANTEDVIAQVAERVQGALNRYGSHYELVNTAERMTKWVDNVLGIKGNIVGIDTETSGLNLFRDKIAGFSLYAKNEKAIYVPLQHRSRFTGAISDVNLPMDVAKVQLQRLIDGGVRFIFHNGKFDYKVFKLNFGLDFTPYWDTLICAHLLNQDEPHGLKYLFHKYVEQKDDDNFFKFGDLFGNIDFATIPPEVCFIYAAHDAYMTEKLYEYQDAIMEKPDNKRLYSLFMHMEMPLIKVCAGIELYGIDIDQDYARKLTKDYQGYLDKAVTAFYGEVAKYQNKIDDYEIHNPGKLSKPIDYQSPKQLAILLYDILHLQSTDPGTPRGTGIKILTDFNLPLTNALLEVRKYQKLMNTYLTTLPNEVEADKRIHGEFNQIGTDTGRFSSENPNLQNIPSHDHYIRKMFKATDGYVMIGADYSQQEPHVLAFLSNDPGLLGAYRNGKDVYAEISSLIFKKPYEQSLEFNPDGSTNWEAKARRAKCKGIVLGLMYGRGTKSVAESLQTSVDEAQDIINEFFKMFPGVKRFMEYADDFARKHGYVETIWGRRRYLPDMLKPKYDLLAGKGYSKDFNPFDPASAKPGELDPKDKAKWLRELDTTWSWKKRRDLVEQLRQKGVEVIDNSMKVGDAERQTVNSIIQGSAADMSKMAMLLIANDPIMQQCQYHMQLLVHDEIIGECPRQYGKVVAKRLPELMVEASHLMIGDVPMKCDVTVADRWTGDTINL